MGAKANGATALNSMLDQTPPAATASLYVSTFEYRPNPNGNVTHIFPALYSYGPHFPLAIWDTRSRDIYVNQDHYSKTTATHRSGVIEGLRDAGYRPNGIEWCQNGGDGTRHRFDGWTQNKE